VDAEEDNWLCGKGWMSGGEQLGTYDADLPDLSSERALEDGGHCGVVLVMQIPAKGLTGDTGCKCLSSEMSRPFESIAAARARRAYSDAEVFYHALSSNLFSPGIRWDPLSNLGRRRMPSRTSDK
jgi:hypothetical protein